MRLSCTKMSYVPGEVLNQNGTFWHFNCSSRKNIAEGKKKRLIMLFDNSLLAAIMFFRTTNFFFFCLPFCMDLKKYIFRMKLNIFSRVYQKLELGMQLDYLIKLNF